MATPYAGSELALINWSHASCFMQNNGILYNADGTKRISNGTLVALTLMIAESRTEEKDVMIKVVVNLINQNN